MLDFFNFISIRATFALKENEKYTFCQEECQTKFVDLIEANNFAFMRFFLVPHIMVKEINFRLIHTVIFLILIQSKNLNRIISRYLCELPETSIKILDFFLKLAG